MNTDRAVKELLSPDNRKMAREIAAHSFVLLKNNDQLLPLKKSGSIALWVRWQITTGICWAPGLYRATRPNLSL